MYLMCFDEVVELNEYPENSQIPENQYLLFGTDLSGNYIVVSTHPKQSNRISFIDTGAFASYGLVERHICRTEFTIETFFPWVHATANGIHERWKHHYLSLDE